MASKKSFQEIATEWQAEKSGKIKESSFSSYSIVLNGSILPLIGDKVDVSEADVREMIDKLRESGVKESSLRNYVQIVKNILKYGSEKGYCDYPSWRISFQSKDSPQRTGPLLLTPTQEKKLVDHLTKNPTPRHLGMFIALANGIKLGEVCTLQWSAVDTKEGILNVIEDTGSLRRIPIPDKINEFLAKQAKGKEKGAYVTTGTTTALPHPKSIRDSLKVVAKNLDLPVLTFQDLRHTFAVRCIESGCELVTLMNLLGISQPGAIYDLYAPYFKVDARRAINGRASLLKL